MNRRRQILRHAAAKPAAIALGLLPAIWLAWRFPEGLGFNPIEALNRATGDWALRFLILTLAISPLAKLTRTADLLRFRRIAGLLAFGYALLHLSSYIGLDQFFAWGAIWEDIVKRNFITVGMVTFLLLVPLAATSTDRMMRRLGARRWRRLHRLIYAAAVLGVVHFFMMVKADTTEPLIYAVVLATLLAYRARRGTRHRQHRSPAVSANP